MIGGDALSAPKILAKLEGSYLNKLLFSLSEKIPKNEMLRLNSSHREVRNILKEEMLYNYQVRISF